MIIITATVDLPPERVDDALAAARPLIEGALTQPGCLEYAWCIDPTQPGRVQVIERWRDQASLAHHFANRWYQDMRKTLGSFGILGAQSAKYRVDLEEPVYDAQGNPRADFFTAPGRET